MFCCLDIKICQQKVNAADVCKKRILEEKNASSSWKKVLFETLNISWHCDAYERNVYLVHSFLLIALFLFYLSQSTSSFFALSNSLGFFFLFFSLTNFHSLESIAFFFSPLVFWICLLPFFCDLCMKVSFFLFSSSFGLLV